MGSHQPQHFMT